MKNQTVQSLLVVLMSAGGASVCGYLWYQDVFIKKTSAAGLVQAGTVAQMQKNVKRKFGDNMVWDNIRKDENLYWNDSIQTGAHSQARITLADGNKIVLGESSLVVLERENDKLSLNLKSGQLIVDSQKTDKTKISDIKINGATLSKNSNESLSFQMDENKGTVRAISSVVNGAAKQILIDKEGHVEEKDVPAYLVSPEPFSVNYTDNLQTTIDFNWQAKANAHQVFEIAKNKEFSKVVISKDVATSHFVTSLSEGNYYWRIRTKTLKEELVSEVRTLDIILTKAPEKLSPPKDAKVTYLTELPITDFAWEPVLGAEKYQFEISKGIDFKEILFKQDTLNNSVRTSKVVEGGLYWRVTAFFGIVDKTSEPRLITFSKALEVRPPPLLFPTKDFSVSYDFFEQSKGIPFKWKPESNETYRFIFSKSSNLSDELVGFETTQAETILTDFFSAGTYFWAVGHKDLKGEWKYSDARKLIVGPLVPLLSPPTLTLGSDKTEFDLLKDPGLKWQWRSVVGAKEYRFKLTRVVDESREETILDDTLSSLGKDKKDLDDGTYKWTVSSVDLYGRESKPAEHKFNVFHGKTLQAPDIDMQEVQ